MYPLIEVEVLAIHDRSTVCWMVVPAPLAVSVVVPLAVTNDRFAEATPADVGANVTVNGRLCPDAMVMGKVRPPSVNTELLELADDNTTLPPLAVRFPPWLEVLSTFTLPKLSEDGVTLRVPTGVVPLPESATFTDGSEAFEVIDSVALSAPETVGANVTVSAAVVPAFRVNG